MAWEPTRARVGPHGLVTVLTQRRHFFAVGALFIVMIMLGALLDCLYSVPTVLQVLLRFFLSGCSEMTSYLTLAGSDLTALMRPLCVEEAAASNTSPSRCRSYLRCLRAQYR